jgi:hypothetical protein
VALVRVFDPVVLAEALLVAGRKPDLRLGGAIGAKLVRRDLVWRVALLLQEFAQESDGCGLVTPPLQEQVQHLALAIDGAPEKEALATDHYHQFVQMPLRSYAGMALAQFPGEQHSELQRPFTLCMALIWASSVYLWVCDWPSVDRCMGRITCAERYSLTPYLALGRGVQPELAIRRGQPDPNAGILRTCLDTLQTDQYQLHTTIFKCAIAEGLLMAGRYEEALNTADEAISEV